MKVLLLGPSGQIGSAILKLAHAPPFPIGWELATLNSEAGDFSSPNALMARLQDLNPDVVINAVAFTKVDLAETERVACEQINAETPIKIANFCKKLKIPFIHFSTDYVYEGTGDSPHLETDALHPQNFYGVTKAKADVGILESGVDHLIFRTSWVYSHTGTNFVRTMLRLGQLKSELKVVNDQFGAPSYAPDLARHALDTLMLALEQKIESGRFPSGVYHLCNSGTTTWFDFAKAILPNHPILGIPTVSYPTPAKRPLNSRLNLNKLEKTFGIVPRTWRQALDDCLNEIRKTQA